MFSQVECLANNLTSDKNNIDCKPCIIWFLISYFMIRNKMNPIKTNVNHLCHCPLALPLLIFLVYWCYMNMMHWHYDALTLWCTDIMMHWHYDALTLWCTDIMMHWHYDALTLWCTDIMMHWHYDALTLWCTGIFVNCSYMSKLGPVSI